MRPFTRPLLIAALLLGPAPSLWAQTAVDPSGHWEGSIQIPDREITFEVDLARNGNGELSGTINSLAEHYAVPLRAVVVDGKSVSFNARRDQPFKGILSADGNSMFGDATLSGYDLPFSLSRKGDARIAAPPRSAPIGKELEGTWNGALDVRGTSLRFVLRLANQPDGTATARLISLDEGELEVPLAITQEASSVGLVDGVMGSFAGALNAEGTELAGTLTQGQAALPLTFRRAAGTNGRR
jgi:hypothetical protein